MDDRRGQDDVRIVVQREGDGLVGERVPAEVLSQGADSEVHEVVGQVVDRTAGGVLEHRDEQAGPDVDGDPDVGVRREDEGVVRTGRGEEQREVGVAGGYGLDQELDQAVWGAAAAGGAERCQVDRDRGEGCWDRAVRLADDGGHRALARAEADDGGVRGRPGRC